MSYEFWWEHLSIKDDVLHLEGFVSFDEPASRAIYMQINDEIMLACDIYSMEPYRRDYVRHYLSTPYNFRISVRGVSQCKKLKCRFFVNEGDDEYKELTGGRIARYFPVGNVFKESYAMIDGWMTKFENGALVLLKDGARLQKKQEKRFLRELYALNTPAAAFAANLRREYNKTKPTLDKEVWLVSDRIANAGDNGEAFYAFIHKNVPSVSSYFILQGDCLDYNRMEKQYGGVLKAMSHEHLMKHLLADRLISSQTDCFVDNPFQNSFEFFRDILTQKKVVFLQHGVIHEDLSPCFSKHNKNLSMFVTSAEPEYEAILREDYGYDKDVVKLTGMPRYDKLEAGHEENIIAVMPTWRPDLVDYAHYDFAKGMFPYKNIFTESQFFRFFNGLLNNEELVNTARSKGVRIVFFPHPLLRPALQFFDRNDYVEFTESVDGYSDVLNKSRLMVTDYSSVAFDFAFMKKPVIYCQFDQKSSPNSRIVGKDRFYDYKRDGFGDVVATIPETVGCIIGCVENSFGTKPKYRQRAGKFFAYHDRNNCQRVYEAIKAL